MTDTAPPRHTRRCLRLLGAALAVTMTATTVAADARAESVPLAASFLVEDYDYGFFYDNLDRGIVILVGGTAREFCRPKAPATTKIRIRENDDGTETGWAWDGRAETYVYEFDGPVPALVGEACAAVGDGDPSTKPPKPLASGRGMMRFFIDGVEGPNDDSGFFVRNSIHAVVRDGKGKSWFATGRAAYDVENGAPVGDPVDFQRALLRRRT